MLNFINALISEKRSELIPVDHDLFGRFVGAWDFLLVDNKGTDKERNIKGEWIFSWILEGTAIQDIFICPSREERYLNPCEDNIYSTTIRIYNPKTMNWKILYGCCGESSLIEVKKENNCIVLTESNNNKYIKKWTYSDILRNSFHWSLETSYDNGNSWSVIRELYAKRK